MAEFKLCGTGVALITPFDTDNEIDYKSLDSVIDRIISGGADFIVVLGTTAETPTLRADEIHRLTQHIARSVAGRIPLVMGVGGNCTRTVIEQLGKIDFEGYSAILSVVPFYNKPCQRGIEAHFRAIADASPLPVVLYNIPGRSGVNMSVETTLRLASHPNIIGVKEASGNLAQITEILKKKPQGFEVISGDDSLTLRIMQEGGSGVISVIANAFPEKMKRLTAAMAVGDVENAKQAEEEMNPFFAPLFRDGNPAGIKELMKQLGYISGGLRLPLVEVSPETSEIMADCLKNSK